MKILLGPLAKIGELFEQQNQKMSKALDVLSVDLVEVTKKNAEELSKQTVILQDIKALLMLQVKQKEKEQADKKNKFTLKMPDMGKAAGKIGLAVISMAAAIVVAGALFMLMPILNPLALLSALAVALIFNLIVPTMVKVAETIQKVKTKDLLITAAALPIISMAILLASIPMLLMPVLNPFAMLGAILIAATFYIIAPVFAKLAKSISKLNTKQLLVTALAMPIIAMGILLTAVIFLGFGAINNWVTPPLEWTLLAGLAILSFSFAFSLLAKSIGKLNPKQLLFASLAIPLIAISMLGVAWIFQYFSEVSTWGAPPLEWTLKAGLAMAIFAIPFVLVAMAAKTLTFSGMIKAMIAAPLIAISILATAWIFQLLPDEYKAPDLEWALSAGIAITIFAIPFAIVGVLAQAITPVGLVLGALGIILIAVAMFVVAWIFRGMPDLSAIAANFTDAIMYPINAMIDALGRIKNEIGIENLLPLAGGLFAIAGGWLALVAALAGQAAGGLFSSVANLGSSIIDGIGSLFGGGKTKTPIELLDMLIGRTDGIIKLADPIKTIGMEFVKVAANTDAVIKGIGAVLQLGDNAEELTESSMAMTTIGTAYKQISDASRVMNIKAIDATTRMFDAIARIAEADGEDAITVIARELMEAVEKLSGTVKHLEDATNAQQKGLGDAIGGALTKVKDAVTTAIDKTSKPAEDSSKAMQAVVDAIQALEDRFDTAIPVYVGGAAPGVFE